MVLAACAECLGAGLVGVDNVELYLRRRHHPTETALQLAPIRFDSEKLNEVMNVFMMGDKTKGVYLVETILKWIVAYKMQLFLHIKASGNTLVGTSNVWGGMDVPNN
jgi:hypothetical protein